MMVTIPPLQGFWDRPPQQQHGEADASPIHHAVGLTLNRWAHLEVEFAMMFGTFLLAEGIAAERVFATLISTKAKEDALNAAAAVFFADRSVSQDDRDDFAMLLRHFSKASTPRNEITHACVDSKETGYFLVPPMYSKKDAQRASAPVGSYAYTAGDIMHFAEKFSELHNWAFHLQIHLWNKYRK